MKTIREKAHELAPELIEFREECHRYPEPSWQEFETTNRLARELDKMGVSYRRLDPTGLVGEIKGGKPGKTIALRSDIDALSILEKSGVPFASKNEGFMHACGHDCHMTNLIGAVRILNDMKDELSGNVRFIFQPGEEIAKGAKMCVEQGALDGVDAAFGMHIWGMFEPGKVIVREGSFFASADAFTLKIKGKACHGSAPEQGVDATVCAAAVVMNLQTIVSRETAAMKPLVVTVGTLQSGARFNIVSGEATLSGTTRCFDVELHHHIPEMMERIIKSTCEAYRCEYEFQYDMLTEPVVNDAELTKMAFEAAEEVGTTSMVGDMIMGAEDFSAFSAETGIPSVFCLLGGGGDYPQHSDYFYIEESSLEVGVAMYAQFAVDYLEKNK